MNSNQIELPVSFGEAFDKLSILDIKLEKIKDQRREEVQKEYNILQTKLQQYINNDVLFYYKLIKKINTNIWEIQDNIRLDPNLSAIDKGKICIEILEENDRRFRVKSKIDGLLNSNLKEQKGYPKKSCVIKASDNIQENISSSCYIRYLSTVYDKVYIVSNTIEKLKRLYSNDVGINVTNQYPENIEEIKLLSDYMKYMDEYFYIPESAEM